jgi:hypothetical protein
MRDNRFPTIVTRRADLGASLTETMREARRLYEITPCKIASGFDAPIATCLPAKRRVG